jgi:hypothetical protein
MAAAAEHRDQYHCRERIAPKRRLGRWQREGDEHSTVKLSAKTEAALRRD